MFGITKLFQLGSIIKNTAFFGSIASGVAYLWSASAEKPEDRHFKNFVDGTVLPAVGDVGKKMAAGASNIYKDMTGSDNVKGIIKGTADATSEGLNAAGGLLQELPSADKVVSGTGKGINKAAGFTWEKAAEFVQNLIPSAGGLVKTVATFGVLAAGVAVGGSFFGSKTINLPNLGTLAAAPFKFATGIVGSALGPIITAGLVIGGLYLMLSSTGHNLMKGLYNMITGHGKEPEAQPTLAPAPRVAPDAPAPALELKPIQGVKLGGVSLPEGVTGGVHTDTIIPPIKSDTPSPDKPMGRRDNTSSMRSGA